MTAEREPIPVAEGQEPAFADLVHRRAADRAQGKKGHAAPPGDLVLPESSWTWQGPGDCSYSADWPNSWQYDRAGRPGQLRTAYVRMAVGGDRASSQNGWRDTAGKPTWVAVGIICPRCGAFWAAPRRADL